uniref:lipid II flippase MurJ n=1 Tax=Geminicoccus flavidas TaxID=2506407 RepID=UPI00190F5E74
ATLFARGDLRTPLVGAVVALAVNLAVGLATLDSLGHLGLAIAASLSSWANLAVLVRRIGRIEGRAFSRRTKLRALGGLACAIVAASVAVQSLREMQHLEPPMALGGAILVAGLAFFGMAAVARVVRPQELVALFRDRA